MGEKTAGVGHFTIPTSPAVGTTVAQNASANTYTAAYVQLSAAAPAAIFITGLYVQLAAGASIPTYMSVQLATGAAAAESIVGQHNVSFGPTSGVAATAWGVYKPIYPPIAVANGIRIAAKTASSVASALAWAVTLECINQSNVVDDGVAVGTVTTVTNQLTAAQIATGVWQDATAGDFTTASSIGKSLYTTGATPGAAGGHFIAGTNAATTITTSLTTTFTGNLTGSVASVTGAVGSVTGAVGSVTGLTASNLDATISSRMATYTQPTGFLAATFPATVASTTNITAGTITTVTNLTNAATAGDLTAAMKTSVTTAATAATPTAAAVTGAVGSVTGAVGSVTGNVGGNVTGSVGSVVGLTASNLDATVSSRLASASYTAPDNASVTAIKAKTDSLAFTTAGKVDAGLYYVNGVAIQGLGTDVSPWRAA